LLKKLHNLGIPAFSLIKSFLVGREQYNKKTLTEVNNYKYLGLLIDNKLSWGDHIDNVFKKLRGLICGVKNLGPYHHRLKLLKF